MQVRDSQPSEFGRAGELWLRAETARTGVATAEADVRELVAGLTAATAKPGARLLVGVIDGRIVATAYGVPLKSDPTSAQVAMLAVDPELWGEGYGTQMLDALSQALREQGCAALRMNVDPANARARALYERHGWQHSGETERVDDAEMPELIYRRKLD